MNIIVTIINIEISPCLQLIICGVLGFNGLRKSQNFDHYSKIIENMRVNN